MAQPNNNMDNICNSGLVIAAGTYDGVLAGWEFQAPTITHKDRTTTTTADRDGSDDESELEKVETTRRVNNRQAKKKLVLIFATAIHDGSIRSLCMAGSPGGGGDGGGSDGRNHANDGAAVEGPGSLLSTGYDETLKTHDWHKRMTSSGEVRTPSDFGTPVVSAFAPPAPARSTHCLVGFAGTNDSGGTGAVGGGNGNSGNGGKLCIYKKRDWSVQHVLSGHDGGVGALAVHPTGKLALSGGTSDGKLKLWDLTKGRLAFCHKLEPSRTMGGKPRYDPVTSLVWSPDDDGAHYALSYGSHVTVRDVATGRALLDVELLSRVHQVALLSGPEGLFVAAACNDGSLPVLAVEELDEGNDEQRRAIMAIEPVDSHLAREERFKCIQRVRDYYVVTANSAGVVSLMNLQGAVNMITYGEDQEEEEGEDQVEGDSDVDEEQDESDDGETELAVDIVESVRLGTGARITCLTAWCKNRNDAESVKVDNPPTIQEEQSNEENQPAEKRIPGHDKKRKQDGKDSGSMGAETVKRARLLVEKAKKLARKKEKSKKKNKKKQVKEGVIRI